MLLINEFNNSSEGHHGYHREISVQDLDLPYHILSLRPGGGQVQAWYTLQEFYVAIMRMRSDSIKETKEISLPVTFHLSTTIMFHQPSI